MNLNAYTDGGSRGNPGDAAIGGVVFKENKSLVYEFSKFIGVGTNNEAEYLALLHILEWTLEYQNSPDSEEINSIIFNLDSKLVVEQINKNWKVKEPRMRVLATKCWEIIDKITCTTTFKHVRREFNKDADLLVNQALDAHQL
jgi:ribonuclease HI